MFHSGPNVNDKILEIFASGSLLGLLGITLSWGLSWKRIAAFLVECGLIELLMPLLNQKVSARRHAWRPQTQALARVGLSLTSEDHPRSSGKGSASKKNTRLHMNSIEWIILLVLTSTLTMDGGGVAPHAQCFTPNFLNIFSVGKLLQNETLRMTFKHYACGGLLASSRGKS